MPEPAEEPPPPNAWDDYYARTGRERPPLLKWDTPVPEIEKLAVPRRKKRKDPSRRGEVDRKARALPLSPLTLQDYERARETRRARERVVHRPLALAAGVAALLLVATGAAWRHYAHRAPAPAELAAESAALGRRITASHLPATQPLRLRELRLEGGGELATGLRRYEAVAEFVLRETLYAPATSNGAQAYENLRGAVADAERLALSRGLRGPAGGTLVAPAMPRVLQLTHRAGETVRVRVPVEADRVGTAWFFREPRWSEKRVEGGFAGAPLAAYADEEHLLWSLETVAFVRGRAAEARDFVLAVRRAARGVSPRR